MKKLLYFLGFVAFAVFMVFAPIVPIAGPGCVPTSATNGMIGCWPQVSPSAVTSSDYFDVWQPGPFPASANLVSIYGLFANPPPVGTNTTPGTGWLKALGVSDALTHWATVTLEFPSFAAFAAYKPSVIATALAWSGAPVVAHTAGYYTIGDGGSATYAWNNASSATADGLFIITPGGSAGGRWILQIPSGGVDIRALGVVVDGTTSADVALAAAIAACGTYGTTLFIPPGGVNMTGSVTSLLQNCFLVGVGIPPGLSTFGPSLGSVIRLNSTSVPPIHLGANWKISGVNFYWPGQTGSISYPPLLSGNGTQQVTRGIIDNVSIINCWDGIAQTNYTGSNTPEAWGDVKITNLNIFCGNDPIRVNSTGDGLTLANVRFSPGAWLEMGASNGEVGQMSSTSRGIHVTAPKNNGDAVNFNMNANILFLGLRYAFLLDSGATLAESQISATFDAVGTIIDSSAGGTWIGAGVQFTGVGTGCGIPNTTWGQPSTGNVPCFNMGSAGQLVLTDFHNAGSQGDFIATAGAALILTNSESLSIGGAQDGGDYYQTHITASGTPQIRIQNNRLGGINTSAHTHGITTTGSGIPSLLSIQGNHFETLNDDVTASFSPESVVSGNVSDLTHGSVSFVQLNGSGGGAVALVYYGNNWDKPPMPTISTCGTSPSAVGGGPNAGHWATGSGTVNACTFTEPLYIFGNCTFATSNAISTGDAPTGTPASHVLSFFQGASPNSNPGMTVFYVCPGMQ